MSESADETTPVDPGASASRVGSGTVYYGAYDDDDQPIGLFRKLQDDEAQTLSLERLTADGTWLDDPSLIDDLHDPEVRVIDADTAAAVRDLLAAGSTPDTTPPDDLAAPEAA